MRATRSRRTAALVAAILVASLATSPASARFTTPQSHDSWIVTLAPGVNAASRAPALAHASGGAVGLVYRHALNGFQFKGSAAAADALRHNPAVRGVYPDYAVTLSETLPYGVQRINAYGLSAPGGAYQAGCLKRLD